MFSFWNRKGNKSPAAGPSSDVFPQIPPQSQDVELSITVPRTAHFPDTPVQAAAPPQQADVAQEPAVPSIPNPHDAAISEVHAKLLQAEQLSSTSTAHPPPSTDPLTESAPQHPPNPPSEVLYDPATGAQRGVFEPAMMGAAGGTGGTGGSCDSEQLRDEVWAHLARIREIQSEIAVMHVHMEGVGEGARSMDVDNDIDVDTVPTQEEEDAAKRAKEFEKLPGKFQGRSDNINAMMAKLDELSQAVTSFHALQPPALSFESAATSRQNTDGSASPGDHAAAVTARTRIGIAPAAMFGSKAVVDQHALHDSPVSTLAPFPTDVHAKP